MQTIKVITLGVIIWVIAISVFSVSYYIPLLNNLELQANIALAIALIPIVGLISRYYFLKNSNASGVKTAVLMLSTGIILDACITVPFLIVPNGGSYQEFFISITFWLIVMEYLLLVILSKKIWGTKRIATI